MCEWRIDMDKYTAKASTVEEALEKALRALGITKEEASVTVVEEGKKGFLGFGQKEAIVTVRRNAPAKVDQVVYMDDEQKIAPDSFEKKEEEPASVAANEEGEIEVEEDDFDEESETLTDSSSKDDQQAIALVSAYLEDVTKKLQAPSTVMVEEKGKQVMFLLDSTKPGVIIGKHGKVLNALQSLAQVLLHRHAKTKMVAIVNAGDYRERREAILQRIAERAAQKVRQTEQPVFLEPMPAFERKTIHYYLSQNDWVSTHSEGKEPHRYLVVEPTDKQI